MELCIVGYMLTFWIDRGMVEPLFTRQQINEMRPVIQDTVDSLINAMIKESSKKPMDIVEKLALPVASYVSNFIAPNSLQSKYIDTN